MDKATRIKVAEAINKHFYGGSTFIEQDIKRFKPINTLSPGGSKYHCCIYAVQQGDLTIMVWLTPNGNIRVKSQAW